MDDYPHISFSVVTMNHFGIKIYPLTIIMYSKVYLAKFCSLRKKISEYMAVLKVSRGRERGGREVIRKMTGYTRVGPRQRAVDS